MGRESTRAFQILFAGKIRQLAMDGTFTPLSDSGVLSTASVANIEAAVSISSLCRAFTRGSSVAARWVSFPTGRQEKERMNKQEV
jgi:hypothetical protein